MPYRILIVEDNEPLRDVLRATLMRRGLEVCVAATAWEALARMEEGEINGIVSDIDLAGTSGFELCESIRRRQAGSEQRCLIWLMSGSDHPELEHSAKAAGAMGIFHKPFNLDATAATIQAALMDSASSLSAWQGATLSTR